jgi:hypothetical protein
MQERMIVLRHDHEGGADKFTTYCPEGRSYELIVFDGQVADAVERLLSERLRGLRRA